MSKSTNMLRTRRKDNNVKPNRRLDRKSSRGMLFENEELRLKTININAEVERGQSDIKKLKRENDQLRREIWYLRDEYDKLDKLLREKEDQESSSTSCSSESESCSSCSEESEAVETSQNMENVQKTNLKLLNKEFDHLSVVPEENSTENSERNSNRNSLPENGNAWSNGGAAERDVIKPDQSYPQPSVAAAATTPAAPPKHFFSPIKTTAAAPAPKPTTMMMMMGGNEEYVPNDQYLGTEVPYPRQFAPDYPGLTLPPLHKSTTDVMVKTDNRGFDTLRSQSSFSNGGNLEELLNDIETISHDILKMSNSQGQLFQPPPQHNYYTGFPFDDAAAAAAAHDLNENSNSDIVSRIRDTDATYLPTARVDDHYDELGHRRPYRSELNVVLMPSPMQLIGVEKYKNLQRSCDSLENLSSASCHNLKIVPCPPNDEDRRQRPFVPVPPHCPGPGRPEPQPPPMNEQTNPFYFGTVRPDNGDFFRYAAEAEPQPPWQPQASGPDTTSPPQQPRRDPDVYSSKTNLLDTAVSSDHVSSENEENLRFKTSRADRDGAMRTGEKQLPQSERDSGKKGSEAKSPKLSIRRKVSIHFKGKKEKAKASAARAGEDKQAPSAHDKKHHSLFDNIRFSSEANKKGSSVESKLSNAPGVDPKTPTSGESKTSKAESSSTSDQKTSAAAAAADRKSRKSSSASPDRRAHAPNKEGKRGHRKHKKSERARNRRSSLSAERYHRERSYSVCTDRSNILDHRLGGLYDDFTTSDRERTNSLSSCDTVKGRKLSNVSHFPSTGKIPWCGCWGNGCL